MRFSFLTMMSGAPSPEEATVNGVITSITRFTADSKEKLVTYSSDGLIWKDADKNSHGQWTKVPGSNDIPGKIIKTAADQNNLYVVSVTFADDIENGQKRPQAFYIKSFNGTKWVDVVLGDKTLKTNDFNIFCTNDVEKDNRSAYLRISDKVYSLSSNSISAEIPKEANKNHAVNSGSKVLYFKNPAVSNGNKIYWVDDDDPTVVNFTSDASNLSNPATLDTGDTPISCLAVTADSLLIGKGDFSQTYTTKGGIARAALDRDGDGKPTALTSFTTNATSQLASSYQIYSLLVVNPGDIETEAAIYASMGFKGSGASTSVTYKNIGLWSYYKERGNWNRE